MKKEIFQQIEIPEGIDATIKDHEVLLKGPEGENKRTFKLGKVSLENKDGKIIIGSKNASKKEKKIINTITAHIRNMIEGLQNKFEYKLKICFSHFPMTVEIQGNDVQIKNFLGEKIPRKSKIMVGSEAKIEGDVIIVTSCDKELAGQTAANFEKATKITKRDRRVFQDGIFITNKPGREI